MNQILNKPYKLIWWSMTIILGLSIIRYNDAIDIQIHDTYIVIALIQIGLLFSMILGIIGLVYWLVRHKKLVSWMTAIHVIVTVLTFIFIVLRVLMPHFFLEGHFDIVRAINQIIFIVILIAILTQFVFLTNLIFSLIRNKTK